jgi:hypothetical protein
LSLGRKEKFIPAMAVKTFLPVGRDAVAGRKKQTSIAVILNILVTHYVAAEWPLTEGQNLSP